MPYRVYILLCSDGSYYTGSAAEVEKRVWQHQEGFSKEAYTYTRRPVKLAWCSEEVARYSDALRFERQIKGWSRAKKEALIRNDFDAIHQIVTDERERREKKKEEISALSVVEAPLRQGSFDYAQDEDTQDEDTQDKDTQDKDTQDEDTQQNKDTPR